MSTDVVDRPKTGLPPVEERKEMANQPPGMFNVQAWSGGYHCSSKFSRTVADVFSISIQTALQLSRALEQNSRVTVALKLTRDIAEMRAATAEKQLTKLVNGCSCGHAVKFVVIEA